jgi:hypothetical protein
VLLDFLIPLLSFLDFAEHVAFPTFSLHALEASGSFHLLVQLVHDLFSLLALLQLTFPLILVVLAASNLCCAIALSHKTLAFPQNQVLLKNGGPNSGPSRFIQCIKSFILQPKISANLVPAPLGQ